MDPSSRRHWISDLSSTIRARPAQAYGLALLAFALALGARFTLADILMQGFPYLTFFPAVILTAFFCGTRAGVLCAMLSGLAAWYFFIPPGWTFDVGAQGFLALAFYVVIVGVDIALIHYMHTASARLRAEQQVIHDLYNVQTTMFQELQHRVANNIQFIASLLMLQQLKLPGDSQASLALEEARSRLESISRIHRRLHDPADADQPVAHHLQLLTSDLLAAAGQSNVSCAINAEPLNFDLSRLTTLSMLVAEVVTNSLKHAFEDSQRGLISISLQREEDQRLLLRIADNGRGMPQQFNPRTSQRLGFKIINSLAEQLGGEARYRNDNGTVVEVQLVA